ncbi:MAG: hypothetical protein MO847_12020 [Candidatus Protistobacter heckmanni]|nr:hypothetical protein [Candidatus Protistobacter heckmanni]
MARINMEGLLDDLGPQMRSAREMEAKEILPEAEVDKMELFRAFKRAIKRKCATWERVPDNHVDAE